MKFLVLQHIECEHPGIFRDLMRAEGVSWDTVELDAGDDIPSMRGYDAMMVMGGPMDVWQVAEHPWLESEMAAIREWVDSDRPYLGFCLGHQLLARAMGGRVGPSATPEIGILPVNLTPEGTRHWLFRNCTEELTTLQWHSAEVISLPPGGVALARSDDCAVNAMAVGDNAVSVQFHIELTDTTVSEWGQVPEYAAALEKSLGGSALSEMQSAADRNMAAFHRVSKTLFDNFVSRIG